MYQYVRWRVVGTLMGGTPPPRADLQSAPTQLDDGAPMINGTVTVLPSGRVIWTKPATADGGKPPLSRVMELDDEVNGSSV